MQLLFSNINTRSMSMEEEPICDITREGIEQLLRKYPRKRPAFRAFCDEYKIIEIEELSEDLALEILEIMDSASYIRVDRAKIAEKRRVYHETLLDTFNNFLNANKDKYLIMDMVDNCYLICKVINVMVQSKNINSVFQPYETVAEKNYFINFIVKLSDDVNPSEMINAFLIRNCKIVKLIAIDDVKRTLEDVM